MLKCLQKNAKIVHQHIEFNRTSTLGYLAYFYGKNSTMIKSNIEEKMHKINGRILNI